ncbi:MAG: hypothetical protein U9Q62_10800, partial [Campylobacterota bacterium]|nr:hypothetical protein [Campylobacterota bacterium]
SCSDLRYLTGKNTLENNLGCSGRREDLECRWHSRGRAGEEERERAGSMASISSLFPLSFLFFKKKEHNVTGKIIPIYPPES